jgi:hypothetical protein
LERIDVSLLRWRRRQTIRCPIRRRSRFFRDVERNLAAVMGGTGTDPKVEVILHYLGERNWLGRNGAIIFSQYRTTAELRGAMDLIASPRS